MLNVEARANSQEFPRGRGGGGSKRSWPRRPQGYPQPLQGKWERLLGGKTSPMRALFKEV